MKFSGNIVQVVAIMLSVLTIASVANSSRGILAPTTAEIQALAPRAAGPTSPPVLSTITPNPNTVGNVALSWSSVNGVDYYEVYVSTSFIASTSSSGIFNTYYAWSTSYTDFEPNGTYYYAITTMSEGIESATSNCQSITIAAIAPTSAPVLAAISPNPTHNPYIPLSWSAVSNAAGYYVFESSAPINSSNIGSAWYTTIQSTQTTYTDYQPANGTCYYAVEAFNGGGSSAPSNCQSVVVIVFVPKAPVLSAIIPNPNMLGNITLSWNSVIGALYYLVYESSSPLTNYNITNYQYDRSMYAFSTTYTDDESNGTYYYVVTARNSSGQSACSNCQSVTVIVTAPTSVPVLSAISPNPGNSPNVSLSWTAVNNTIGYHVYRDTTPITISTIGSLSSIEDVHSPQTTYTDFVYNNGTYYYAIVAYNGGGTSDPSNCQSVILNIHPIPMDTYIGVVPGNAFLYSVTVNMPAGGMPGPGMTNGTYNYVVTVDNLTSHGYYAMVGYHFAFYDSSNNAVYSMSSTEAIAVTDTTVTSPYWFINKNIANKTYSMNMSNPGSYSVYLAAAWNDAGVMLNMTEVMANNSQIYTVTLVLVASFNIPQAPQNLQASAGDNQVVLSWQPPADDGGSPIMKYNIYRGSSSGIETYLATVGDVTTYTDTSVSGGQTYYYIVRAVNLCGEGQKSSEASASVGNNATPGYAIWLVLGSSCLSLVLIPILNKKKITH